MGANQRSIVVISVRWNYVSWCRFTLQTIGQKNAKPSSAAIILSLESLFAAVGGWFILNEGFASKGLLGCGLMLSGIFISQVKKNHSWF